MKTILHIIKKEFQQFRRDPKMFGMILVSPIIQLIFLGYATNFDVKIVHTTVFDMDKTEESRLFIDNFKGSGYFSFDYYVTNYGELQKNIENGKSILALVIPKGFQKKINKNESVKVQAIFDGSDGNTASISAGYVNSIVMNYSKNILVKMQMKSGNNLPTSLMETVTRVWYNPELKTRNFMVPGIVGLLIMIITLLLTSLAVVKEKEIGTMEQIIVTPIKPYQLIYAWSYNNANARWLGHYFLCHLIIIQIVLSES
jgi:ABC-2 type transport system permease protein